MRAATTQAYETRPGYRLAGAARPTRLAGETETTMSGPGGMVTKRDQRRESRREQYQRRQAERQAERQRQLRQQRIRRYGFIGGGILVVLLLALGISQLVIHGNNGQQTAVNPKPATGQTVDGLQCLPSQGGALHIHQYLDFYVNGQRVNANPGIGIVDSANCLYPLHVHNGEPNIIHNETSQQNVTFTLGQFFDIWGVALSNTQVSKYKVDSTHKLVIKLIDSNGNVATYTGNPHDIPLGDHQTIYILYNSPNVAVKPFTDWANMGAE